MSYILHLETATKNCSAAVSRTGKCISLVEATTENYSHDKKLHVFIEQALQEAKIKATDLACVAISKGPGSYTGLRIGTAAAKGLCYALDLPLVAVNTLEIMMQGIDTSDSDCLFAPMLDARRMEVYTMVFDTQKNAIKDVWAEVLSESSFCDLPTDKTLVVFGEGANKFMSVQTRVNVRFYNELVYPSAKNMISLALTQFQNKQIESLAYFEPFYLKEFIAAPPKKQFFD